MDRRGASKPLSSHMTDGQMQLAMEMNEARRGPDERAMRCGDEIYVSEPLKRRQRHPSPPSPWTALRR